MAADNASFQAKATAEEVVLVWIFLRTLAKNFGNFALVIFTKLRLIFDLFLGGKN
jgi:hypothetical protein